jgi:hypothetical protein
MEEAMTLKKKKLFQKEEEEEEEEGRLEKGPKNKLKEKKSE